MKIGDRVLVRALVKSIYEDKYRKLIREEFDVPKEMIYTGYTFRQEGRHVGGRYGSYFEPPYLSVEKTIKVIRVKEHERHNEKFAFPEDAEVLYKHVKS
jgi:hypothetical protein